MLNQKKNILPLLILAGLFVFLFSLHSLTDRAKTEMSELKKLSNAGDLDGLNAYFRQLSEKKGSVHAYNTLKSAGLPMGADHLVGHVVGELMFEELGIDAMQYCTTDLQNACSHAVIIGYLSENGGVEGMSLPKIQQVCAQSPGGEEAYLQCFHGLGHGITAFLGYDLAKAVSICDKAQGSESTYCVGGSVMEIVVGGDHDKDLWAVARTRYINDDPLSPCNTDVMPQKHKVICYTFLTPRLFEATGYYNLKQREIAYERAFRYCDNVDNTDERDACFRGFGKEFAVVAAEGSEQLSVITDEQLLKVHKLCAFARIQNQVENCIDSAADFYYWGGENTPVIAVRLCNLADEHLRSICFEKLIDKVKPQVIGSADLLKDFCSTVPRELSAKCLE